VSAHLGANAQTQEAKHGTQHQPHTERPHPQRQRERHRGAVALPNLNTMAEMRIATGDEFRFRTLMSMTAAEDVRRVIKQYRAMRWVKSIRRGTYTLTPAGKRAIEEARRHEHEG